jgi:hypothetical protein
MEYYFIYKTNYNYIGSELKNGDKSKLAHPIKINNKSYYDSLVMSNIIKCIFSGKDSYGNDVYIISSERDIQNIDTFKQNFTLLGSNNLMMFTDPKNMSKDVIKIINEFKKTPEFIPFKPLPNQVKEKKINLKQFLAKSSTKKKSKTKKSKTKKNKTKKSKTKKSKTKK